MSQYLKDMKKKTKAKKDITVFVAIVVFVFALTFIVSSVNEQDEKKMTASIAEKALEEELTNENDAEEKSLKDEKTTEEGVIDKEEDDIIGQKETKEIDRTKEERDQGDMSYYKKTAQQGDGLTHIARRVLNEHADSNLSAEQKLYAEDYIQKRLLEERNNIDFVLLGEVVNVSYQYVDDALEKAQDLTPSQIDNLSYFL